MLEQISIAIIAVGSVDSICTGLCNSNAYFYEGIFSIHTDLSMTINSTQV